MTSWAKGAGLLAAGALLAVLSFAAWRQAIV